MIENGQKINQIEIKDVFEDQEKIRTFKHCGPLEPIDEIDAADYDPVTFKKQYFMANKPIVFRNALNTFDCGTAFQRWSLDYLNEKCGHNKVYVRRNTDCGQYKTGKAYHVDEIEFRSYVEDFKLANVRSRNSYLAVQNLKKAFVQVDNELKMPPFVEKLHAGPFLWIAHANHYEYTHMDPDDNVLMVIRGRKMVRLYGCNVHNMTPNSLGSKGRTIQSQIDCDDQSAVSSEAFERFQGTTCYFTLLREGDVLYFPAFWWHQVTSPENTISVNCFFGNAGDNAYVSKLFDSPQQCESFKYWLFNIIMQNKAYPSFERTVFYLKESLSAFLFKQWHERLTEEQMQQVYEWIIDCFDLKSLVESLQTSGKYPNETPKNPPQLKIRGLIMRKGDEDTNDD